MSLLKKIKAAVAVAGIKPNSHTGLQFTPTVQEDVKSQQAVKRVREMFSKNWDLIQARAMQAHSCDDPVSCTKQDCFVWSPDTIVGEPYVVMGRTPLKKGIDDYTHKEDRHAFQIKADKKKAKIKPKKCSKGCHNKVYNQCYDCAQNGMGL